MDARMLADLGIGVGQAYFEATRKPWQEETGLGKDAEVGFDCAPRGVERGVTFQASTGSPRTVRIAGLPVGLRPILPEDRELLKEFWDELSERSRTLRFLTIKHRFSGRDMDRLVQVDQEDHVAWVAVDLSSPREKILGEVRFVKTNGCPGVAEFGVTVADWMQGRGLGRMLMEVLAGEAERCGVSTLRGFVSDTNAPMMGYATHRGARIALDYPGVLRVDLPVAAIRPLALAAE